MNLIRRLGNMSYSFYLVHGFAVVALLWLLLHSVPAREQSALFWLAMAPVFLISVCCGASLFLTIEKPLSLKVLVSSRVSATAATILQQENTSLPAVCPLRVRERKHALEDWKTLSKAIGPEEFFKRL